MNHVHSSLGKGLIERTMQYIKDRTEGFGDYFPCKKDKCELKHMAIWFDLFIDKYNGKMLS